MTQSSPEPALSQEHYQIQFIEQGLLGFEAQLNYELSVYDPQTPFYWLRSLEDPEVAFIVMEPCWLADDYSFDIPEEEAALLKITSEQDVFVLVLCTVPANPLEMTANLLGPLVVHRQSFAARQVILDQQRFPVRYPVFAGLETEAQA